MHYSSAPLSSFFLLRPEANGEVKAAVLQMRRYRQMYYLCVLGWLVLDEILLINRAIHALDWRRTSIEVLVAILVLAVGYQFERNRLSGAVWSLMIVTLALALLVR
jgi:uncharacterized membrane protein YkgB